MQKVEFGYSNFSADSEGFPITYVTYEIKEVLFGKKVGKTITLQQIGGLTGDSVLTVSGAPLFEESDEDIIFIRNNGSRYTPAIGRYRIYVDSNAYDEKGYPFLENQKGQISKSPIRLDVPYFSKRALGEAILGFVDSPVSEAENPIKNSQKSNPLSRESLKKKIDEIVSLRPDDPKAEISIDQRDQGLAKVKFEAAKQL